MINAALLLAATTLFRAPLSDWEHGIPLGNGLTGGLLWGNRHTINLSLDRGDLWDLRVPAIVKRPDWTYANLQKLVRERNVARIHQLFDDPYDKIAYPTKLPAGRLVLTFPANESVSRFSLDTQQAQASATIGSQELRAFFSARQPIAMLRVTGAAPKLSLDPPSGVAQLGYPRASTGTSEANGARTIWEEQRAALGLCYAIVAASKTVNGTTTIAVAITSTHDAADPLALGRVRTARALASGYAAEFASHTAWWQSFWAISHVRVPDLAVERQYVLDKYYYGSASRPDAPPIPLQGVWTEDDGSLAPWKGDYHNDLNTQMTYVAYQEAGLFPQGESFLNFNWNLLPVYQRFARSFYGVTGAAVPGVESQNGQALGGWCQYALSPVMGAWIAQSYYEQWRYTMNPAFLSARAYPFTEQIGTALLGLMKTGADGKLHLPLSTSPEMFDDTLKAWLPPSSNFDVSLERWLFGALGEMANAQGKTRDAAKWYRVLAKLPSYDVERGVLTIAPGVPLPFSHRHFSNLISIFPLGTLNVDGGASDRALIRRSIDDAISKGSSQWMGYSFGWMACLLEREGRGDEALSYLHQFLSGYIFPNGFHVNGYHGGPFTLEGNFLAMQAVQEMLLQSWGGVVRVFPATPSAWSNASFDRLRAEGGYVVSAARRNGHTSRVYILATANGTLRLRDPFAASAGARWNRPVRHIGTMTEVYLRKGEFLTGETDPVPQPVPTDAPRVVDMSLAQQPASNMRWFRDAKFGMMLHCGVYSVYDKGEWYYYNAAPKLTYAKYVRAAYLIWWDGAWLGLQGNDRHGMISRAQAAELRPFGGWLHKISESTYGTRPGPWEPRDSEYGFTRRAGTVHAHVEAGYKGDSFVFPPLSHRAASACYDVYSRKPLHCYAAPDGSISVVGLNRREGPIDTVVAVRYR